MFRSRNIMLTVNIRRSCKLLGEWTTPSESVNAVDTLFNERVIITNLLSDLNLLSR